MQRFIGLDVHGQSCTLTVMGPSGRRLGQHVVETNAKALIERIRSIAGEQGVQGGEARASGPQGRVSQGGTGKRPAPP
jgi:hypothetical protein